jgi:hypothetical protein
MRVTAEPFHGPAQLVSGHETSMQSGVRGDQSVVRSVELTGLHHGLGQRNRPVQTRMDHGATPVPGVCVSEPGEVDDTKVRAERGQVREDESGVVARADARQMSDEGDGPEPMLVPWVSGCAHGIPTADQPVTETGPFGATQLPATDASGHSRGGGEDAIRREHVEVHGGHRGPGRPEPAPGHRTPVDNPAGRMSA